MEMGGEKMKTGLNEIIYIPTLKCNYNCIHCGQNRLFEETEESASFILNHVQSCNLLNKGGGVIVTGGEPFLKEDIEDFILGITNNQKIFNINITTNGFFYDRIEKLFEKIKYKEKFNVAISVDGLESAHNQIRGNKEAFGRAMKTIELLIKYDIPGHVNTVMQESNIVELIELKEKIREVGKGKIQHAFIPLISQISKTKDFVFSKDQLKSIWPYITETKDKKNLLSKGNFKIENCHAGINNLLISPQGKLYTCLTGYSYFESAEKEKYYIGDLHENTLDNILQENRNIKVWEEAAVKCIGCNNPCEIIREEKYFNLNCELSREEIERLYKMELEPHSNMVYDKNWYGTEGEGELSFRWMKGNTSCIYIWKAERIQFKIYKFISAGSSRR